MSRAECIQAISLGLDGIKVHSNPELLTAVDRGQPVALIGQKQVRPHLTYGLVERVFEMYLISGLDRYQAAENQLDSALAKAISALEAIHGVTDWDATKGIYEDSYHAYIIEIKMIDAKE